MTGMIYLEDGSLYRGKGFGAAATKVGELIFNTAMSGYQEMLTDPAVAGQIVNMTYPLIGNYGVSNIDDQSDRIHAFGLVTRDISFRPSNRCSVMGISEWLREQGVPGIYNVDTRMITRKIRSQGSCKCVISTEGISKERAQQLIENEELSTDDMKSAGVEMRVTRPGSAAEGAYGHGFKVAALDFGIRRSTVAALTDRGCDVVLCPYGTTAEEILAMNPQGLFLSDGPGDPLKCELGIKTAAALIETLPVFGVGMGHLVLALASGAKVYKLKYGHHGDNHGVLDVKAGKSVIASQNHSYAVDEGSLAGGVMAVSHRNMNDDTVEGLKHKTLPVMSVAFSPEGGPGSNDAEGLFDVFIADMIAGNAGHGSDGKGVKMNAGKEESKGGAINA